jgi:hypothetical protein
MNTMHAPFTVEAGGENVKAEVGAGVKAAGVTSLICAVKGAGAGKPDGEMVVVCGA